MKLTTKGRYAVTAMLDLAMHAGSTPVPLADIACRQDISVAYLERLFACLRDSGLVLGIRGPGGGYRLARPAAQISVADVIVSVDEGLDATRCGGARDCRGSEPCLTHELWARLTDHIEKFLADVSLADLVHDARGRTAAGTEHAMHFHGPRSGNALRG